MDCTLPEFEYLYGKPITSGFLRTEMADFKVFENLPFEPCGEGEHLFIRARKTGQNTGYVAKQLANYFGVKENLVSYAGLKDRFAVTEQTFGIHVPGKKNYDLSDLNIEGIDVLSYERHNKKLRIGALLGNTFELTLRQVSDVQELSRRWHALVTHGVPNYFGEQRFGINGGNIGKALSLFSGEKVKDKKKRGIYLSAARSLIFNQMINDRIKANTFDEVQVGDVCMLAGTQSVFLSESVDENLKRRLREKDIDITAPMWGAGELMTTHSAFEFEKTIAKQYPEFCQGLCKFGLKQERRRIRLVIEQPSIKVDDDNVVLIFSLPAGSYATTVMRELLNYTDLTERNTHTRQSL